MTDSAVDWFETRGVSCTRLSPYHLRVAGILDYWPSTGTWRRVDGTRRGKGRDSLVAEIRNANAGKLYGFDPGADADKITAPSPKPVAAVKITKKRRGPSRRTHKSD